MSAQSPLRLDRDTRSLLWKWGLVLLVPVLIYTFLWQGDSVINAAFLGLLYPNNSNYAITTPDRMVQALIFSALFYLMVIAIAGYVIAVDSGRHRFISVWIDVVIAVVIPILFVALTNSLVIGLAFSAVAWGVYFLVRNILRRRFQLFLPATPSGDAPVPVSNEELRRRAILGSVSFGVVLAVLWIVVDVVFLVSGSFPSLVLITILLPVRTVLLVGGSYFMGLFAARVAQYFTADAYALRNERREAKGQKALRQERRQLVPSDEPLRSSGARVFYLVILLGLVVLYPALDRFLFSYGTDGRLASYGDAGYYVILALGLNIVVGFAGLLDLGYVAFFAIGAYSWAIVGSSQLGQLFNIFLSTAVTSSLFWPMLLVAALVAALFGVILGLPTLRLRGDYLAIVTLGFGEIVPIVALNLRQLTNGANGLVGIQSPGFFGLDWDVTTPAPYYYLILVLIGITIFATIRLRDSRLGRAWVAIREDEIAAASSGINLRNTKLLAFGAGAFFSGIAGAYHGAKLGVISPDVFSYGDSIIFLAMVVIGGLGSIPGVIVGALAVYSLDVLILGQLDTFASNPGTFMFSFHQFITQYIPNFTFGNIRNLTFGVILIVIMIFRPEGLIPSARRKRELRQNLADEEPDVLGSLDVTPSDPAFESEVRVE
jgi:ABC-type branched-subunit amino acid transport system permease subunit